MAISFSNVPSGIRVPLFYAEVDASKANLGSNNLKTLLIGQMLTDSKAKVGQPVLVTGDSQGKELFGRGSQLALMNSAFRANCSVGEVWALPVAEPSGNASSCTVTITGKATASGTLTIYIASTRVQCAVALDDEPTAIATALAAAINAKPDLPVKAEGEAGVVTLNAKNKGLFGNDIRIVVNLQGFAAGEELPEGVQVVATAMAGGTGSPDLAELEKALGDEEYDFIAVPFADTASLEVFTKIMNDKTGRWSSTRQVYGHVYSCKRDTVSNLQSFGKSLNDQHLTVVGIESEVSSVACEVLGAFVGQCATAIQIDPARPLQTLELVGITSAPVGKRFTLNEKQTLLTNGIATCYTQGGYMRIERAITTYQVNAFGDADVSYLDSETLHTLAYIIRNLKSIITSKYPRHKLANDGTHYGPGQAIVTPSVIRGELIAQYQRLEEKGIVENVEIFKKHLIVERDVDDPNRVNVLLPPDLVNGLRVFAVLAQFRLQYN